MFANRSISSFNRHNMVPNLRSIISMSSRPWLSEVTLSHRRYPDEWSSSLRCVYAQALSQSAAYLHEVILPNVPANPAVSCRRASCFSDFTPGLVWITLSWLSNDALWRFRSQNTTSGQCALHWGLLMLWSVEGLRNARNTKIAILV